MKKFLTQINSPFPDQQSIDKEFKLIHSIIKHIPKKRTMIDIGANEGFWSCICSSHFKSIHSYEPVNHNFEYLIKNTKDIKNIKTFNYALSNLEETYDMFIDINEPDFNLGMASRTDNYIDLVTLNICERMGYTYESALEDVKTHLYKKGKTQTVTAYSLDKLERKTKKIDFIKIDVERDEIRVLEGAKDIISNHRPYLYVEQNDRFTSSQITDYLFSIDYVPIDAEWTWKSRDK